MCGSKHFMINNEKSRKCDNCGFTYYANPCSATAAFIINEDGEMLVVRRGKEPAKGTLDLPGGFADMDETLEEAMRREIREETGIEVESMEYQFSIPNIYRYSGIDIHTLDAFYFCPVKSGTHVQTGKPYAFYMLIPAFDYRASTRPGPPIDALSSKASSTHRGMSRLFPIVLHRLTNLIRNNIQLSDVSSCHLVTG